MSSQVKYAGTISSLGSGNIAFLFPDRIKVEDNSYAIAVKAAGSVTKTTDLLYLRNFDFTIPQGATITGFKITLKEEVETPGIGNSYNFMLMFSATEGATVGDDIYIEDISTNQYYSIGGSTEKFNTTIDAADVNNSSFGLTMSTTVQGTTDEQAILINSLALTVYYTGGVTSPFPSFQQI
jgi:hypothetical protein